MTILVGMAVAIQIKELIQGPNDLYIVAGSVGTFWSGLVAFLLATRWPKHRRGVVIFWLTPLLAIALSPIVLLGLAGPITAGQAGHSAGEGVGYALPLGILLWSVLGLSLEPGDSTSVPDDVEAP